jgi:tetratricopeptide (TPR) repeat protein
MSDPVRSATSRQTESSSRAERDEKLSRAERDEKIEQLLLSGLDHYFAGQYEQAINVWTRALFLDRSHARARAYIERARSAQAERQRESEALLIDGAAAVRRGDSLEARRLLDAAMVRGGASDEVLALLERVERLEHLAAADGREAAETARHGLPARPSRSRAAWFTLALLLLVIVAAGILAVGATPPEWAAVIERSISHRPDRLATSAPILREDPLPPVPRRSEAALARARALVATGRLRDALPLLESIRTTDPERPEADRLRGEVQRELIAIGPLPAGGSAVAPPNRDLP